VNFRATLRAGVVFACLTCLVSSAAAQTIAGGVNHTVVLKPDGTVWTLGGNSQGQIGDNSTTSRKSPIQVSGLSDIVAVAAGANHSLAITSTGSLYAWGDNWGKQLGDGTTTDRLTPIVVSLSNVVGIAAGEYHSLALLANGDVYS
jgi:alpha-tubulin suppressor-like RCC1 family protein